MKNHSPGRWLPPAALALLLLLPAAAGAQLTIARGQKWEQTITSTTSYAGAWLSTRVCVQYTSPSSPHTVYTGLAFWDAPNGSGSDFFKIRAAFNETGPWSWALTAGTGCAPPGNFTPNMGSVTVNPDATGLPLYQYGPLRLSSTLSLPNRFLLYSGAGTLTPFVWIGDTSWSGPYVSYLASWQSYTADRQGKKFSVIQTAMPINGGPASGPPQDVVGRPAFVSTPGGTAACAPNTALPTSTCYPNKAFWDYWDSHIADINAKGMLAVVIGLFKRVDGVYATWPAVADSQGYARWAAARLAGYYTALAPGFDELPPRNKSFTEANCGGLTGSMVNQACRARMVGMAIREATPESPIGPLTALVTHHIGGGCPTEVPTNPQCLADYWLAQFQNETWLDFQLFQSSQGDNCVSPKTQATCLAERASQRPRTLYDAATTKPLVDGEAIYDQFGYSSAGVVNPLYTDYYARLAAFYTLLSGGAGFTHGIGGTWDWGGYYSGDTVGQGTSAPSSVEIPAIGQLFAPFRWNRLVPDCQPWASSCSHIKNSDQATLPAESKRVYSRDSNGLFGVAYVPGSSAAPLSSITLDLSDLASFSTSLGAPWSTEWFDPARSCYCTATASGSGPYTFSSPKSNADWALVIRNTTSFPPPASRPLCNTPTGSTVSCSGRP
jgi:hypothetical protein